MDQPVYQELLAAWIRGSGLPGVDTQTPLQELSPQALAEICRRGKAAGMKAYRFKTGHEDLPRVRKVLGFLRGIAFDTLLDVGSGRGVFLFPLLQGFPWVQVTSAELLEHRVALLQAMTRGGVTRLRAVQADVCSQPFGEKTFDVVTLLEVLEHIPQVELAVAAAVKMARKFVVVSVPNQPDDNPEHIHLLTKERLTALFAQAGCTRLRFDGVNGHLLLVASLEAG